MVSFSQYFPTYISFPSSKFFLSIMFNKIPIILPTCPSLPGCFSTMPPLDTALASRPFSSTHTAPTVSNSLSARERVGSSCVLGRCACVVVGEVHFGGLSSVWPSVVASPWLRDVIFIHVYRPTYTVEPR